MTKTTEKLVFPRIRNISFAVDCQVGKQLPEMWGKRKKGIRI